MYICVYYVVCVAALKMCDAESVRFLRRDRKLNESDGGVLVEPRGWVSPDCVTRIHTETANCVVTRGGIRIPDRMSQLGMMRIFKLCLNWKNLA